MLLVNGDGHEWEGARDGDHDEPTQSTLNEQHDKTTVRVRVRVVAKVEASESETVLVLLVGSVVVGR